MNSRIAVFLNTIDPIFLPNKYKNNCFVIVDINSPLFAFAQKNFPRKHILTVSMYSAKGIELDEKKILYNKHFLKAIKQNNITHLIIPHQCSETMTQWAKEVHISLIGTNFQKNNNLEDKIYFDKLLKKNKISSPKTLTNQKLTTASFPVVVQRATSYGLFGTWFCTSLEEVKKHTKTKKTPVLIREYKKGISIGVSIFLDQNHNYFFSAFRRQCFSYKNTFPSIFLGVQWLPSDYFNSKTTEKIYKLLNKLAKVLSKEHFYGLANIDVLISSGNPYILECNPRLSSATTHIFSIPDISGYSDPYGFFLNTFLKEKTRMVPTDSISNSSFDGCLLDIDIQNSVRITTILPVGVYEIKKNNITYIGADIRLLNKNRIFMSHEILKKGVYSDITVCSIIANCPLFDYASGELNEKGKEVFSVFLHAFTKK